MIPTKDRPVDLELTARTLLAQTVVPEQLIIVDQSPGSDGRLRIQKLFGECQEQLNRRTKLTYVWDPTITGLTLARNRAMEQAEGDIWLFLDDDVMLEPTFVEELVAVYRHCPTVTGVSGIITNYPRPPLLSRIWNAVFMRGPFYDGRQAVYWNADRLRRRDPVRVDRLGGGLMSFRASAIRGRRFDEHLSGVCDGEDVDFCARLDRDTVLVIAPRARLVHKQSPNGRLQDHYLRREARAQCFLYWKNWQHSISNSLCFLWLTLGYSLLATMASMRRLSLQPWRALRRGMHEARRSLEPIVDAEESEHSKGSSASHVTQEGG